jgi:hypothetical protein
MSDPDHNLMAERHSVTRNTEIYVYHRDRGLVPEEHGRLLGYGVPAIAADLGRAEAACSYNELKDLYANCMALPHITAVVAAALLSSGKSDAFSSE